MIAGFERKRVAFSPPQTLADNSTLTSATIDTSGYLYGEAVVDFGVTNIAIASMYIQESDLANMSGATNFANTIWGTSANDVGSTSTLPTATSDNTSFHTMLDLRGHKKYLKLIVTTGVSANNTALISAYIELSRPAETPQTALAAGFAQRLIGGPYGG